MDTSISATPRTTHHGWATTTARPNRTATEES